MIDPNEDPAAAKAANVRIGSGGTIIVQMGDRQERLAYANEEEMTGALVRLISQKKPTVYFLTGHDEYSPTGTQGRSYSDAKQVLERKGYTVKELPLLADKAIPSDADGIVVAGPLKPITEDEMALLSDYVKNGGSLVALMEPEVFTNYNGAADPLAKYLSENWGIQLAQDVVIDGTTWQQLGAYTTVGYRYANHHITEDVQGLQSAFITARSIQATDTISDVVSTSLIFTNPQGSWAETDMEGIKNQETPQPNPEVDQIGNIPLAVASENSATKSRVVVIGDPDFAGNGNFDFLGNGDLFVNSIDWASQQENTINITPRTPTQRFMLPPTQVKLGLIILVSCLIIPGTFLAIGIVVAVQRRRRG